MTVQNLNYKNSSSKHVIGLNWRKRIALILAISLIAASTAQVTVAQETLSAETLALFEAVEDRDMDAVKSSITAGADINAQIEADLTAADRAVDKGYFKIAHYILAIRQQQEDAQLEKRQQAQNSSGLNNNANAVTSVVSQPLSLAGQQTQTVMPEAYAGPITAPVVPPAPYVETAPLSVADADPLNPAPALAPIAKAQTFVTSEPIELATTTQAVQAQPIVQAQPVAQAQPVVEASQVIQAEPIQEIAATPVVRLEPVYANGTFLKNANFKFGQSKLLANSALNETQTKCLKRPKYKASFCIEDVDWAPNQVTLMKSSNSLFRGQKTIVRYDENQPSRLYTVFSSGKFAEVEAYFTQLYGSPAGRKTVSVSRFGKAPLESIVVNWTSVATSNGEKTHLEIRKFDDVRDVMPDANNGFVRIYKENSKAIFDQVSEIDFILNM